MFAADSWKSDGWICVTEKEVVWSSKRTALHNKFSVATKFFFKHKSSHQKSLSSNYTKISLRFELQSGPTTTATAATLLLSKFLWLNRGNRLMQIEAGALVGWKGSISAWNNAPRRQFVINYKCFLTIIYEQKACLSSPLCLETICREFTRFNLMSSPLTFEPWISGDHSGEFNFSRRIPQEKLQKSINSRPNTRHRTTSLRPKTFKCLVHWDSY